jgi:cell division protein FtsI/penicillin-binding protein 2
MNKEQFKVRATFIFFIFVSLYAVIIFNLYCIQIKNRDFYVNLGTKQYNVTRTQAPERALIYDRHGQPLALNKQQFSAFVLPKKLQSPETLEPFLHKHFPSGKDRLYEHRTSPFLFIKRKLTNDEHALVKKHALKDLHLLEEPTRYYPVRAAGPIVGITNVDNVGQFGIEKLCDEQLTGVPATFTLQKDARSHSFYFTKETQEQGSPGKSVTLTIDAD